MFGLIQLKDVVRKLQPLSIEHGITHNILDWFAHYMLKSNMSEDDIILVYIELAMWLVS